MSSNGLQSPSRNDGDSAMLGSLRVSFQNGHLCSVLSGFQIYSVDSDDVSLKRMFDSENRHRVIQLLVW